jgi:hypothetical protein
MSAYVCSRPTPTRSFRGNSVPLIFPSHASLFALVSLNRLPTQRASRNRNINPPRLITVHTSLDVTACVCATPPRCHCLRDRRITRVGSSVVVADHCELARVDRPHWTHAIQPFRRACHTRTSINTTTPSSPYMRVAPSSRRRVHQRGAQLSTTASERAREGSVATSALTRGGACGRL